MNCDHCDAIGSDCAIRSTIAFRRPINPFSRMNEWMDGWMDGWMENKPAIDPFCSNGKTLSDRQQKRQQKPATNLRISQENRRNALNGAVSWRNKQKNSVITDWTRFKRDWIHETLDQPGQPSKEILGCEFPLNWNDVDGWNEVNSVKLGNTVNQVTWQINNVHNQTNGVNS